MNTRDKISYLKRFCRTEIYVLRDLVLANFKEETAFKEHYKGELRAYETILGELERMR